MSYYIEENKGNIGGDGDVVNIRSVTLPGDPGAYGLNNFKLFHFEEACATAQV